MLQDVLPVCLNLKRYRILIVGGGRVAWQKLNTLLQFNCRITVVAKKASDSIIKLAIKKEICLEVREFKNSDLRKFNLVYACTDNPAVNRRIARLAKKRAILFNIADNPSLSSFISPAVYKKKKMLITVSTSGKSPKRAVRIRDELKKIMSRK